MEREFLLEEIQDFYPKHKVTDTGHHYLIKDYFNFGDFKLSAKIRKSLPLFKNGQPLLPTQPFHISETEFSKAIGTSADCLHVQGWFGDFYEASKSSDSYISFGDITNATMFFAIAEYDQAQNWFRQGISANTSYAENAIKFIKHEDPAASTGQDIWLVYITTASIQTLWRQCAQQRQTVIEKSDEIIRKTTSFPTSKTTANASNIPA